MNYLKTLTLAFLLSFTSLNLATAQSDETDPLAEFDELFKEIEGAEESIDLGEEGSGTLESVETEISTEPEATVTSEVSEKNTRIMQNRLLPKTIPEGKESFVLYRVPGAFEFRGMTFTQLESSLFYNRFQKCDIAEDETITSTLANLKLSQGAPLECRETMKYKFAPYRSFRAQR